MCAIRFFSAICVLCRWPLLMEQTHAMSCFKCPCMTPLPKTPTIKAYLVHQVLSNYILLRGESSGFYCIQKRWRWWWWLQRQKVHGSMQQFKEAGKHTHAAKHEMERKENTTLVGNFHSDMRMPCKFTNFRATQNSGFSVRIRLVSPIFAFGG